MTFVMEKAAGVLWQLCDERVQAHKQNAQVKPWVEKGEAINHLKSVHLWPEKLHLIKELYVKAKVVPVSDNGVQDSRSSHLTTQEYYQETVRIRKEREATQRAWHTEAETVQETHSFDAESGGAYLEIKRPGYRMALERVIRLDVTRLVIRRRKGKKR